MNCDLKRPPFSRTDFAAKVNCPIWLTRGNVSIDLRRRQWQTAKGYEGYGIHNVTGVHHEYGVHQGMGSNGGLGYTIYIGVTRIMDDVLADALETRESPGSCRC